MGRAVPPPCRSLRRSLAAGLALLLAAAPLAAQASTLARPLDPVVLTGAELAPLFGPALAPVAPDTLAAFRREAGGWVQVPLQVDERAVVRFEDVYGPAFTLGSQLVVTAYTDPATFTGADPEPAFDDDDELVLMAADAGARAASTVAEPPGVLSGSGVELALSDPLDGGQGYLYVFRHVGALDPAAGEDRVAYDFNLLSGSYLATYGTAIGPNPEASLVTTDAYRLFFTDRWVWDDLGITAGQASGVDVLDRHKFLFQPGQCSRTEETFSAGQGAFFANVDGPLRGIRSVLGANSGVLTQRDQLFYEGRHDVVTIPRVHEVPMGGMDLLDYAPAASGMLHASEHEAAGVVIDGSPDVFDSSYAAWEVTTGSQGTLSIAHWFETTITTPITVAGYYEDDLTPSQVQCTGDPYEYGTSGPWVTGPLPNTDPLQGPAELLRVHRTHCMEPPAPGLAQAAARAELRARQASTPLVATVGAFAPCSIGVHCTAGTSASGCNAWLSAAGAASASAPAGFVVRANSVEGQKDGLFYYGTSGAQAAPWGNGTSFQCVVPPVRRTSLLTGSGTPGACDGTLALDLNAEWSATPHQRPAPGEVVDLQLWYRDPQSSSNQTTSLSSALRFCVGP